MVAFDGRLFLGTLPSGTVHSMEAGMAATDDRSLTPGRRHVAAVRRGGAIELFVDGVVVGRRGGSGVPPFDLGAGRLVLGGGPRGRFDGKLAGVALWSRALDGREIAALAAGRRA